MIHLCYFTTELRASNIVTPDRMLLYNTARILFAVLPTTILVPWHLIVLTAATL
jgi:hypothetical protein